MWFKKNKVSTPLVEVLGALFDLDVFAIDETTMDLPTFRSNEIRIGGHYFARVMYQVYKTNLLVCFDDGNVSFSLTKYESIILEPYWKAAIARSKVVKIPAVEESPKYNDRDKALEILTKWLGNVKKSKN